MAGRKCTVCAHPKREAIEAALVGGGSYRGVAGHFGAKATPIERHSKKCMPLSIAEATKARGVKAGDATAKRLADTHRRLGIIIRRNMKARDDEVALKAVKVRLDAMAYEKPPVQRVELSEAVRKLSPEQVADELASAVLEMAGQDAKLGERLRSALAPLLG